MGLSPFIRSFQALLLAVFCIYVVVRVANNAFSWNDAPPPVSPGSPAAQVGQEYAALLSGTQGADQKLLTLWKLVEQPRWDIPAWSGNPLTLAGDVATRARAFSKAGNIPQAASHNKILLQWAQCLLNATGPGSPTSHRLALTSLALQSVAETPETLRYPALQHLLHSLSQSLTDSASGRLDQLLSEWSESETGDTPRNLRLLANRSVLKDELAAYLKSPRTPAETKTFTLRTTAKAWLLICPVTASLFKKSLQDLGEEQAKIRSLTAEISLLLDGHPASISLPK